MNYFACCTVRGNVTDDRAYSLPTAWCSIPETPVRGYWQRSSSSTDGSSDMHFHLVAVRSRMLAQSFPCFQLIIGVACSAKLTAASHINFPPIFVFRRWSQGTVFHPLQ